MSRRCPSRGGDGYGVVEGVSVASQAIGSRTLSVGGDQRLQDDWGFYSGFESDRFQDLVRRAGATATR